MGRFLSSPLSGYLFIACAIALLGTVYYIYNEGKSSCVAEQNNAVIQEVNRYENKKTEIRRLGDDDLIQRYCRWVYDVPYSECVANYSYVGQVEADAD